MHWYFRDERSEELSAWSQWCIAAQPVSVERPSQQWWDTWLVLFCVWKSLHLPLALWAGKEQIICMSCLWVALVRLITVTYMGCEQIVGQCSDVPSRGHYLQEVPRAWVPGLTSAKLIQNLSGVPHAGMAASWEWFGSHPSVSVG